MKKVLISLDDIARIFPPKGMLGDDGVLGMYKTDTVQNAHIHLKVYNSCARTIIEWFDSQPDVGFMNINELLGHKDRVLSKMETTENGVNDDD